MYVPDILETLARIKEEGNFGPIQNVMELGAQEVFATGFESSVERFLRAFRPDALPSKACLTDLSHGTARELYRYLGFNYSCVDVTKDPQNKFYRILFDLNLGSVPALYKGKYDFVTNLGVTQHALHQLNAFRTIHEFAKPSGYMFHYLPFTGRYDDLYYYYQPNFFERLALANDYELIGLWLFISGDHLSMRSIVPWNDTLWDYIRYPVNFHNKYLVLAVLFRKKTDYAFCEPQPSSSPEDGAELKPGPSLIRKLREVLESEEGGRKPNVLILGTPDFLEDKSTPNSFVLPGSGTTNVMTQFDRGSLSHTSKYRLVCNSGASQNHIDQVRFLSFVHGVTEVGGYMAHLVPFLGYDKTSLFHYDLSFFEELAYVNSYKIKGCWLSLPGGLIEIQEELFDHLRVPPERHRDPLWALILFRKRYDHEFLLPFQGCYKAMRDECIANSYSMLQNGIRVPDDLEPWVPRKERLTAMASRLREVVDPHQKTT